MLKAETRVAAPARALHSAARSAAPKWRGEAAAIACIWSARNALAAAGRRPRVISSWRCAAAGSTRMAEEATRTATPGMAANRVQNATPAAATQMWSRASDRRTRRRMSHQPRPGMAAGRSAPRPADGLSQFDTYGLHAFSHRDLDDLGLSPHLDYA